MTTIQPSDAGPAERNALWAGVDRAVDRARSLADLRAHGLHLLAAQRWRELGHEVPDDLVRQQIGFARIRASTQAVLLEVRSTYDGRILILKGSHTAAYYPGPHLRPYHDLDLLVDDPDRARRALTAAGFQPLKLPDAYYSGLHHMRPLVAPASPSLVVELHRRPNWLRWGEPPTSDELFSVAVSDRLQVPGVLGLPPAYHALVLAAHGWAELPFRRLLDLVDAAAVATAADRREADRLAARWDMRGVWRTTISAADAMFLGAPAPAALRVLARDFATTRDRTVMETHVRRSLSTFWALPPSRALIETGSTFREVLRPAPSDSWMTKLARARRAIEDRSQPVSEHVSSLGADAQRAPRFRRR